MKRTLHGKCNIIGACFKFFNRIIYLDDILACNESINYD